MIGPGASELARSSPTLWRPILLVVLSSTSIQFGTAIATTVFADAGPLGAVWLRGLIGAVILGIWIRPDLRALRRDQIRAVVPYAFSLGAMVALLYLALAQAPLGAVSAILMLGPLTVSALGSRGPIDLGAVALAAIGVAFLTLSQGGTGPLSPLGIGLALGSAAAFALYIHTGKEVGKHLEGLSGVVIALAIVSTVLAPVGAGFAGPALFAPATLLALAVAGLLASAIPFSLEVNAMRSLSAATFGLLLSFEPAIGAIAGFLIRSEALALGQVFGIALVVLAGIAALGPRGWTRRIGAANRALMANPKIAALGRIPLFDGLSARDLGTIATVAEERDVAPGTVLTEQGQPGDEFFVVANGEVAVDVDGGVVRRLGPGGYLGEIALLSGGNRTATATAVAVTRLYVLDQDAFGALLRGQPRIEDKILTTVSERMRYH
jgi:inner membrane transporter RhtA